MKHDFKLTTQTVLRPVVRHSAGFSLVELVIVVAIIGMMLALALPAFSNMLRNNQIRAAAEAVLSGVQQARAIAVSTNQRVFFTLTDNLTSNCSIEPADAKSWVISMDSPENACDAAILNAKAPSLATAAAPRLLGTWSATEKAGKTQLVGNGVGQVSFDSFGRPSTAASIVINMLDNNYNCGTADSEARCLTVLVSVGGQASICDQQLAATKLGACPAS